MRGKFIAVFGGIVLVVGILIFALLRVVLGDLVAHPEQARNDALRSALAASAQLQLEALNFQRWLDEQGNEKQTKDPFFRENESVRSEQATAQSDRIFGLAASEFRATPPSLVAYVDDKGFTMGRNGSSLLRGENLGIAYPALLATLAKGITGSDIWVNKSRNEQMLVSYAAVRDSGGRVVGGLLLGTPLNDGRLARLSEVTSGRPLALLVAGKGTPEVVAKSANISAPIAAFLTNDVVLRSLVPLFQSVQPQQVPGAPTGYASFGTIVSGYGDGRKAVLVTFSSVALVESLASELIPVIGISVFIGILLVLAASVLLGNYISRPIVELETGILAIINGQTERRFEIEHAELGGLVFSINSLLNQLMGVQEESMDEGGRSGESVNADRFQEALSVDLQGAGQASDGMHAEYVKKLAEEASNVYYKRLFSEYIDAKKSVGDPVDYISEQAFLQRIQLSEEEAAQRDGKKIRYKVETRGREVALVVVFLN